MTCCLAGGMVVSLPFPPTSDRFLTCSRGLAVALSGGLATHLPLTHTRRVCLPY